MKMAFAVLLIGFSGLVSAEEMSASSESLARGHIVYGKFCAKCHGPEADGRGKDAYKYAPAPTNFHIAQAARPYMVSIVQKGGKPLGRSEDMPDWGTDLTEAQIQDVVDYIMSVRTNK